MPVELEGGCSCKEVRYRLTSRPMFVHCCHCRDCQRETGSAFVLNALIERDRIELFKAEPIIVTLPTASGLPHDVYRCPNCQIALWSDYGRRGILSFLRVGTLDNPHVLAPDVHIYTRSKVPWLELPADVPAFEEYYDLEEVWPTASLARRDALLKTA
ncbi:GFA family protein [Afifella sp. JA880]|uniref:GFA family protein n=1 Tax=Afifella sp. JA880 TaxID=2975280 RepID=UPI0021BACDF9|nr:GFA family protein [Afifella sp. JA880]MCT8267468.1 GFA family protein [Afifella sp. JA880]